MVLYYNNNITAILSLSVFVIYYSYGVIMLTMAEKMNRQTRTLFGARHLRLTIFLMEYGALVYSET
mgnify:CR=1 FL=1